jgi:DNA-binding PadR family transcriptional regulator
MHGYDLLAAYLRQEVEDWASVSKAQVYYALEKLTASRLLSAAAEPANSRGRKVHSITPEGSEALCEGLADRSWARTRIAQPFTTWVGLSVHAESRDQAAVIKERKAFLREEIDRERESLRFIQTLDTPRALRGASIVRLVIEQLRTELEWIEAEFIEEG